MLIGRKLTENKLAVGVPQPELLEDWDQRFVTTTLTRGDGGNRIIMQQVADKDEVSHGATRCVISKY